MISCASTSERVRTMSHSLSDMDSSEKLKFIVQKNSEKYKKWQVLARRNLTDYKSHGKTGIIGLISTC